MLKHTSLSVFLGGILLALPALGQLPQSDLPRLTLRVGQHSIDAQVAATPSQQGVGLMHRDSMPQGEGMLFPLAAPTAPCLWMKDTRLPLSAAFLSADGVVLHLADMEPMTLTHHCSPHPARFILEMNRGWFASRGLAVGSKIAGVPPVRD